MRTLLCTSLLLLIASAATHAQRNGISLGAGIAYHGQTDLNASPLQYTGSGSALLLAYRRTGARHQLVTRLAFTSPDLTSRITTGSRFRETASFVTLDATLLRTLRGAPHRWQLRAGAEVAAIAAARDHEYAFGATEFFGDLFVPVRAVGAWELALNERNAFTHSFALPLGGLALRTPYTGSKHNPPVTVEGPFSMPNFEHNLRYTRVLSPRWNALLQHRLWLIQHDDPRRIRLAQNRLAASLELRW